MTSTRLPFRLLPLILVSALAVVGLSPPASAAAGDRHAVGYEIRDSAGSRGSWIGSYSLSKSAPKAYCADPMKRGPKYAGSYRGATRVRHWKNLDGRAITASSLQRTAWILSKYGNTTSKRRAAAVDTAVYALTARGTYAYGAKRSDARLRATGQGKEIKRLTRRMLDDSLVLAGPYRLSVVVAEVSDSGDVATVVRLASTRRDRPIPRTRVAVDLAGDGAAAKSVVTNSRGEAYVVFRAVRAGTHSLAASARDLPASDVWVVKPTKNAQRLFVSGRTQAVRATAKATVKAQPKVSTKTSRATASPGQRLTDAVTISGLVPDGSQPGTAELFGPFRSRTAMRCSPRARAGRVSFDVTGNGRRRTPSIAVNSTGYYTWLVRLPGNVANHPASHACGLRAETGIVRKPPYSPPKITAGYSSRRARVSQFERLFASPAVSSLRIANARISAPVRSVGTRGGTMSLPSDVSKVGWLNKSARTGDMIGTTVVAGHVSDKRDRPGALWNLGRVKAGHVIEWRRAGRVYRYKVTRAKAYSRTKKLPASLFGTTGAHRLVLVSCTDRVRTQRGGFHYRKNLVVFATPIR